MATWLNSIGDWNTNVNASIFGGKNTAGVMQQASGFGKAMGGLGINANNIGGIANTIGQIGTGLLAGQNQTGVGNALQTIGGLASNIPGVGGLIGAGVGVVGGLINAAFGSHINDEFVQQTQLGANQVGSQVFNANTNGDLLNDWQNMTQMSNVSKSEVGSDGWFSDEASSKTRELNEKINAANQRQLANFNIAAQNVDTSNDLRILQNMAAYGGPINSFRKYYADGGEINTPQFFTFEPQTFAKGGYLNQAKALIRQNEGWKDKPYSDAPKGKNWRSVGYGFNDSGFREKYPEGISKHYEHGITKKQAEEELDYFLNKAEKQLKSVYGKQWNDFTDSQKAAILDTYYQRPASVDKGSRFYKAVTAGEDAGRYLGVAGYDRRNKIRQDIFGGDYSGYSDTESNPSSLQEVTPFTPVVHDLDLSGITPTQAKALSLDLTSPTFDLSMFGKPMTAPTQQAVPTVGTVEDFLASYGDFEENLFEKGGNLYGGGGYTKTYIDSRGRGVTFPRIFNETDEQYEARYAERAAMSERNAAANKDRYERRRTANEAGAARLNGAINTVTNVMEEQAKATPFTGQEIQQAAEEQRQEKLDKWGDYKKGINATITAAELGLSGASLLGAYANWRNWATAANATKRGIANLLQKAQLPMQVGGTLIDGYQTYDALQNNDNFNANYNGISAGLGVAGSVGASDMFLNSRLHSPKIDRVLDTMGVIQNSGDFIKFGYDSMFGNKKAEGGPINIDSSKKGTFIAAASKHGLRDNLFEGGDKLNIKDMNIYDFGGGLTHGADWDTGINWVNEGGSHRENPLGGVQMGVDEQGIPNLVEQDEAIWNGDYVFSKRMKVPKKLREKYGLKDDATFADAVAKLTKESEERPMDAISRNTQEHILGELADSQEELRMAKAQRAMEKEQQLQEDFLTGVQFGLGGALFADGGGIHIDPSKRGTFKAQASKMGMGVQEAASHILANKEKYSPAMVKKAVFAHNFAHALGGSLFANGGDLFSKPSFYNEFGRGGDLELLDDTTPVNRRSAEDELVYDPRTRKYILKSALSTSNRETRNKEQAVVSDTQGTKKGSEKKGSAKTKQTKGATGLNLYGYYTNGNDGISTPTGFKVDRNGKAFDYTPEYRELVSKLGANDIRAWAAAHPNDSSLKSFLAKGNKLENLTDEQWRTGATDGKYGFMHHVADQIGKETTTVPADYNWEQEAPWLFGDVVAPAAITDPMAEIARDKSTPTRSVSVTDNGTNFGVTPAPQTVTRSGITDTTSGAVDGITRSPFKPKQTWTRYAPMVMSGLMGLKEMLTPADYGNADSIMEAAYQVGSPVSIGTEYLGDYRKRDPFDERYLMNIINQRGAATNRNMMNLSGGNRAAAMAGILSNDLTTQMSLAEAARQSYLANRADDAQVAEFNRGTNQFNATAQNQRNQFLAGLNSQRQQAMLSGISQGARLRQAIKDQRDAAISANLTNLTQSLGDLGKENGFYNMLGGLNDEGILKYFYGDDWNTKFNG